MPTVFYTRLFGMKQPDYRANNRLTGTSWLNASEASTRAHCAQGGGGCVRGDPPPTVF